MNTAVTKVFITVRQANRVGDPTLDCCYFCVHESMPIDFSQDIFVLDDSKNRRWYCYELDMQYLNKKDLGGVAARLLQEYSPRTPKEIIKFSKSPFVISAVAVRANGMEELELLLGTIQLKGIRTRKKKQKMKDWDDGYDGTLPKNLLE